MCCELLRKHAVLMLVGLAMFLLLREAVGETPTGSEQRARIRKALDALIQSPIPYDAEEPLLHIDVVVVVPALIEALREEDAFSTRFPDRRRRVYSLLVRRYLTIEPKYSNELAGLAYEQFMNGLFEDNYYIKASCAGALAVAPKEFHQEVAVTIGLLLRGVLTAPLASVDEAAEEVSGTPPYFVLEAIRTLGSLGDSGKAYLPEIERVFRDENASILVRSTALDAMLRLEGIPGGIDGVLDYFHVLDPGASEILLGSLGARGSKTNGVFDGRAGHQGMVRRFVIECFDSESLEVRRAALESLIPVFGYDWVVFDSPTEYRLNPEIEGLLERMAAHEPDKDLRERAAKGLGQLRDRLDYAAKRILHYRQQLQENSAGKKKPAP